MDIGLVKKENNRQVYDGVREQEIHDNIAKKIQVLTDKSNINTDHKMLEESFEDIFKLILDRSKKIQKEI